MERLLFLFVAVACMVGGTAQAQPLNVWLTEQIDHAYVRSVLEDDEFRLALYTAAGELAEGYRVADLSECRLRALESIMSIVMAERRREKFPQEAQLPSELASLVPSSNVERKESPRTTSPQRDALGWFTQSLLLALYSPEYEPVDAEAVREQINILVHAQVEELQSRNPSVVDKALADKLTELWLSDFHARLEDCFHPDFKAPLEQDVFDSVLKAARSAAPSSLAADSALEMMLQAESHGLELAAVWIMGQYRTGNLIHGEYNARSLEIFGPADHDELGDKLEAAGLDRRVDRRQIRLLDGAAAKR